MQVKLSFSLGIPRDKQQVRIILRLLDIFSLALCISVVYQKVEYVVYAFYLGVLGT